MAVGRDGMCGLETKVGTFSRFRSEGEEGRKDGHILGALNALQWVHEGGW